jgi:hypothetical protein
MKPTSVSLSLSPNTGGCSLGTRPLLAAQARLHAFVRMIAIPQSREAASWGKCRPAASALRPIVSAKTLAETSVLAQRHQNIVFRAASS